MSCYIWQMSLGHDQLIAIGSAVTLDVLARLNINNFFSQISCSAPTAMTTAYTHRSYGRRQSGNFFETPCRVHVYLTHREQVRVYKSLGWHWLTSDYFTLLVASRGTQKSCYCCWPYGPLTQAEILLGSRIQWTDLRFRYHFSRSYCCTKYSWYIWLHAEWSATAIGIILSSVCLYVCLSVTKWVVAEQENRNYCRPGKRFYNFQPLHRPYPLKLPTRKLLKGRRLCHLANKLKPYCERPKTT